MKRATMVAVMDVVMKEEERRVAGEGVVAVATAVAVEAAVRAVERAGRKAAGRREEAAMAAGGKAVAAAAEVVHRGEAADTMVVRRVEGPAGQMAGD